MSLSPGARLGPYEIVALLGTGGMGEVYRARDPRLNRDVAVKVLSSAVGADADRRERFVREARAVAALSHPNIVVVHSVEEDGEACFLTMELLEGRTLADVIRAHGLPLDQLLTLAIPLADAVSAAHARGITHRDLKPANVMVTADGRVKVLDFGLAKLRDEGMAADGSATTLGPRPLTGEGRIVGTVAYMSPEQAEGKPVDHRSDIFSLGVMLYEMSTGERPFKGDTSVSTLSSILRDTPRPITEINPGLPRDLARLIRRALAKDPEQRVQSAKDLRNELQELKRDLDSGELAAIAPAANGNRRSVFHVVAWSAGGALVVAAAWLGQTLWRSAAPESSPSLQVSFTPVTSAVGVESYPALSPDGKWIAYVSGGDIQMQSIGDQVPLNLTKDEPAIDTQPAFSPDGERIAFRSGRNGGGLYVMSKMGQSVKRLTDRGFDPAWTPDGKYVVFGTTTTNNPEDRTTLSEGWRVEVATSQLTRITVQDFMQPAVSPHGQRVAFWGLPTDDGADQGFSGNNRDLWTIRLDGTDPVRLTDDAPTDWSPIWSADGRFLYFASDRGGTMNLWRMPIDEASGRARGAPEAITTPAPWLGQLTRSGDGRRFAYAAYAFTRNVDKVPFDPVAGTIVGPPEAVTTGTFDWYRPDPAPDGESVVMVSYHRQEDLYTARRDAAGVWRLAQLTNDAIKDRQPRWSPDGTLIAFYRNAVGPFGVWTINPDGGDLRQRVAATSSLIYPIWSPDGSRVMTTKVMGRRNEIFSLGRDVVRDPLEMLPAFPEDGRPFSAYAWSKDSRQIAGYSGAPPSFLWVYSFDTKSYTKIGQGVMPVWLDDNRRLLYSTSNQLFIVDTVTKQSRPLLAIADQNLEYPRLTRDQRSLFYTHATTNADIWLMTIK